MVNSDRHDYLTTTTIFPQNESTLTELDMEESIVKAMKDSAWQTTAGVPAGSKGSESELAPKKDTAKAKTESTHLYKNGRKSPRRSHKQ